MNLEVLLPAAAGLATGLLAPMLRAYFGRQQNTASIAEDQARAMSIYWERIESLEKKNEGLEKENQRLLEENQGLAAQVGRLRNRLDTYETGC